MAYFNINNICLIGDSDAIIKATLLKIESKDKSLILNTGDPKNMLTVSLLNNQLNFDKIFNPSEYSSFPTLDNIYHFQTQLSVLVNQFQQMIQCHQVFLNFLPKCFLLMIVIFQLLLYRWHIKIKIMIKFSNQLMFCFQCIDNDFV